MSESQGSGGAPPGTGTSQIPDTIERTTKSIDKLDANRAFTVNLASLSLPQLRALQTRVTSELEHLTSSHAKLRAAQSKFRDCVNSITDGVTGSEKKGTKGRDEILVPLTSSLYVKGRLTDREKVLVDVGTGFYVEKVRLPYSTFRRCLS